jgi:chromate transporter
MTLPVPPRAPDEGRVDALLVFWQFLVIGATSFGGAVPYLRSHLVARRHWLDEKEFVELLSISQSLPGLNATNMAILVGQKLRGPLGAAVAILGMCLPGALIMCVAGMLYREHGDHAASTAALKGVAAAAVGLVLATAMQLSRKALDDWSDYIFVAITVVAVNWLHQSVLVTLIVVGIVSILWHHPGRRASREPAP